MPPHRLEEAVELADAFTVDVPAGQLDVQIGQVALQQRPVHLGETVDVHGWGGQELAEPGDRDCAFHH